MINGAEISKLSKVLTIALIANAVMAVAAVVAIKTAVVGKTASIAVDASGRVFPVIPLDKPTVSESRVVAFVEECLRTMYAHDFLHYARTLTYAQSCFTPTAADAYMQGMDSFAKLMVAKRMSMGAMVPRMPRVVHALQVGGIHKWDVEASVEVFMEGRSERVTPVRYRADVRITRVPLDADARGIQIERFNISPEM